MWIKKSLISLVVLGVLFALQPLKGQSSTIIFDFNQAVSLVDQGRLKLQAEPLTRAFAVLEPCANTVTGRFECIYQAARACLYLSRGRDLDNNRHEAEKWDDKGIALAKLAVSEKGDSADAHSLLALLYETKLSYGDIFTGMDIGPKAGAETKEALALDPGNAQAQLAAGIQYVMAPPIGGGDVKKGIATLQKVLELDPRMDEAYYWLAKAYRKQNNRADFKKSLDAALQMNLHNRMAQRELGGWK